MRIDDAWHNGRGSTWQLLLQFVAAQGPAGEHETVRQVIETLQGLGVPSPQVNQIKKAVSAGLRKSQEQTDLPAIVRIWVSDGYRQKRARSGAEGQGGDRQARGGWGFFVIQKHEAPPPAAAGGAPHLVELFLYQEGEDARRDGRS